MHTSKLPKKITVYRTILIQNSILGNVRVYTEPILMAAGTAAGFFIGLLLFTGVTDEAQKQVHASSLENVMEISTLKGIVQEANPETDYIVVRGISPYSPNESAPFRIKVSKYTTLVATPEVKGLERAVVFSQNTARIPKETLASGDFVIVGINRASAAELHASYVSIAAK